jgi:hypothetical protein
MNKEIEALIRQYAAVYKKFEELQSGDHSALPNGDQKTGVIGEYYAKCYVYKKFGVDAEYAKSGECYDLRFISEGRLIKIQVKSVSAHSKTRIVAPLNLKRVDNEKPFDYLYLISLDENFIPDGFYVNDFDYLEKKANGKDRIQGSSMKGKSSTGLVKDGSGIYDFSVNRVDEFLNFQ